MVPKDVQKIAIASFSRRHAIFRFTRGSYKIRTFDAEYYKSTYPDVSNSGVDPIEHFVRYGCQERRKPSPLFDPDAYLAAHPELDPVTTNPFQHFLIHRLRRKPVDKDLNNGDKEQKANELKQQLLKALRKPDISESTIINTLAKIRLQSFLNKEGFSSFWTATTHQTAQPLISVIYVLYGKAELLLPTLESLISECEVGLEIIIIDNASSDHTHDLLRQLRGTHSVLNPENKGFIAAANQGGSIAKGKFLLFLNNDTILQSGSIRSALKTIQQADNIGVVGGKIILLNGTLQEAGSILYSDGSTYGYGRGDDPFDSRYMYQRDVLFTSGCFFLTPRNLFLKLGGFDINYAPAYYEDVDYCLRTKELGYRTVYDPQVELFHYEHGSSNREKVAEMMLKNRARLLERHGSLLQTLAGPEVRWENQTFQAYKDVKRLLYVIDHLPAGPNNLWAARRNQIIDGYLSLGWQVTVAQVSEHQIEWSTVRRRFAPSVHYRRIKEADLAELLTQYEKIIAPERYSQALKRKLSDSYKSDVLLNDEIEHPLKVPIFFTGTSSTKFSDRDGFLIATDNCCYSDDQTNGLRWFLQEIYPLLERTELRIVRILGRLPENFDKSVYPVSVEFIDSDADRSLFYHKSKCLVLPFRSSSNSILTFWQAACLGLPMVVSDAVGQAIGWPGFNGFKSSSCLDNQQFASLCAEVAEAEQLWQSLQLSGLSRGLEECSQERFLRGLGESI